MTVKKSKEEDFEVEISDADEDTIVLTSSQKMSESLLNKALSSYAGNEKTYSKILNDEAFFTTTLTEAKFESLAFLAQENLHKIQEINSYIDFYLNKDDIIGKTYEIIEANTNSKYTLSYPKVEGRNKETKLARVKTIIEKFNKEIELEELIIETIPYAYSTGNRVLYLRQTETGYQVDRYPLGMVQLSSYKINNEPVVVFSLPNMISRITGLDIVNISNGYGRDFDLRLFPDMEDEVKSNFPIEVYKAYLENKSTLIKLNTDLTAVIRTNNRGKRYGLSPIFKALNPALKLEIQEKSDSVNSKARGKKIIFQKISDKLINDGVDLAPSIYSHNELIKAWSNELVLYTGAPWVDSVSYVEPKIDNTVTDNLNYYRSKTLSALGISFLNGDGKTGMASAQINLSELMRIIDKISKQLEHNIYKWYQYLLNKEGLPIEYAPTIKIIDSELMELELKMKLSDNLFNKYGMSFKSTYEMLGMDYQTEKDRRTQENDDKIDEKVFSARQTAFTFSAKGKEDYDDENKNVDNKDKQNETNKDTVDKEINKEGEV